MLFFIMGCPTPGCKSLFIFLPTSGIQALKDKRFESKLASEACYSRGGDLGMTKIIHEHNITEAIHGEKRQWFFPPPAFKYPSQPPLNRIRECRMPFSDPVCGQRGSVWRLEPQTAG